MSLLKQNELNNIASAISDLEKHTDAEMVCVLSKEADSYYYIPTLWAAILSLVTLPLMVWFNPLWLEIWDIIMLQWGMFIITALLLRFPKLKIWIVPKSVKFHRAAQLARCQFLEQNLHSTQQQLGILLFVSEAEHYVEILVDQGISAKIGNDPWDEIIDHLTTQIKDGHVEQGFLDAITKTGEILCQEFPASHEKNELPNRLVLL